MFTDVTNSFGVDLCAPQPKKICLAKAANNKTVQKQTKLDALPDEVLVIIFQYVLGDQSNLAILPKVSKLFEKLTKVARESMSCDRIRALQQNAQGISGQDLLVEAFATGYTNTLKFALNAATTPVTVDCEVFKQAARFGRPADLQALIEKTGALSEENIKTIALYAADEAKFKNIKWLDDTYHHSFELKCEVMTRFCSSSDLDVGKTTQLLALYAQGISHDQHVKLTKAAFQALNEHQICPKMRRGAKYVNEITAYANSHEIQL